MIWPAYAHESIEENEEHTSGGALLPFPRTVTITKLGGRVKQLIRCMSENALEEKKKGGCNVMEPNSKRHASVSLWIVLPLLILAAVIGGLVSYSVAGRMQPAVASTTTVTETSVSTSLAISQTSASSS